MIRAVSDPGEIIKCTYKKKWRQSIRAVNGVGVVVIPTRGVQPLYKQL